MSEEITQLTASLEKYADKLINNSKYGDLKIASKDVGFFWKIMYLIIALQRQINDLENELESINIVASDKEDK